MSVKKEMARTSQASRSKAYIFPPTRLFFALAIKKEQMMKVTLRRGPYSWLVNGEIHGTYIIDGLKNISGFKNMYRMGQLTGRDRQGMRKTHFGSLTVDPTMGSMLKTVKRYYEPIGGVCSMEGSHIATNPSLVGIMGSGQWEMKNSSQEGK